MLNLTSTISTISPRNFWTVELLIYLLGAQFESESVRGEKDMKELLYGFPESFKDEKLWILIFDDYAVSFSSFFNRARLNLYVYPSF